MNTTEFLRSLWDMQTLLSNSAIQPTRAELCELISLSRALLKASEDAMKKA